MRLFAPYLIAVTVSLTLGCRDSGIGLPAESQGTWRLVRSSKPEGYYHAISFADANSGWAVGETGRILHTTDGGETWTVQASGVSASLTCVHAASPTCVRAGGDNNTFGLSTDGGTTWAWQHPAGQPLRTFLSLASLNEREVWIVDNYSGILHTSDAGLSWTAQASGTPWAITAARFSSALEGWAAATNRVVIHTTDGGVSWRVQTLDSIRYGYTEVFTDIFCRGSRIWIGTNAGPSNASNAKGGIVMSTDGGKSWQFRLSPDISLQSLAFVDDTEGWAAGFSGILHTTDGGHTWSYAPLPANDHLFVCIAFVDRTHGWAITFGGAIYRYQGL